MDNGFILLSRSILDSDVFASQKLLKIWVWCLCKANFKDKFTPFKKGKGETIIKVKRGSFIFGRHKAEEELFIDGSTIYKSILKLQDMKMIKIDSSSQYSVITICKYDEYQQSDNYKVTAKEQVSSNQVATKEQLSNTTKNDNNYNNYNNNINIDYTKLLEYFNSVTNKKVKVVNTKVKGQINARLREGYTKEDIARAIKNCSEDKYHIENDLKYLTLEFITRADKLERYSSDVVKNDIATLKKSSEFQSEKEYKEYMKQNGYTIH
jgi:uncharacterized phage protein (TIGR02220 family)